MGEQLKTIGFAAAVCLVCSLLLAVVYSSLREEQERNKANDLKVKVLSVFGKEVVNEKGRLIVSQEEIDTMFDNEISGKVLNSDSEEVTEITVGELTKEQMNDRDKVTKLKEYYPLYIYTDPTTATKRYAIHVSGMGLWSVVKGYLALDEDLSTIAGITFYDHKETPGLGGEIEKEVFRKKFQGKKLFFEGEVKEFKILKPGAPLDDHCIDGISGATMTCNGVAIFINSDFAVYNKYFEDMRQK